MQASDDIRRSAILSSLNRFRNFNIHTAPFAKHLGHAIPPASEAYMRSLVDCRGVTCRDNKVQLIPSGRFAQRAMTGRV
jgi:hypothetical protein